MFPRLSDCIDVLTKQVQLDYMRTMNKITFDKMIRKHPEKFAYVQPQDPEMPIPPETGMILYINAQKTMQRFHLRAYFQCFSLEIGSRSKLPSVHGS